MTLLVYSLYPAIMLLLFGGLAATGVHLVLRPDGRVEAGATHAGRFVLGAFLLWMLLMTVHQRQVPVLTFGQLFIFLAFLIWAGYSYVQLFTRQQLLSMLPMAAVILLLLVGMSVGVQPGNSPRAVQGAWPAFHITLSLAGVALLLGSGVFGAGALLLHRQIARRSFGTLFAHLPSLEEMQRLRRLALNMGWLLITVSLGSAYVWALFFRTESPMVIMHLHPMITLWVLVSALVGANRFRWIGSQKLSWASLILASSMLILVVISVIEIFTGATA